MERLWIVVILMGIVTYLPRMLPITVMQHIQLPSWLNRFLRYIPFAALGALIFPEVLDSTGDHASALAGGLAAVLLAWFRVNILLVVLGAIGGVLAWELLF